MIDPAAYLERMKYAGDLKPTAQVLAKLQQAHLLAVPFENLDIHLGQPLSLDLDRLWEKIVVRKRGGICYELNGLFGGLLEELGFHVVRLTASSANDDGTYLPEFDHLILHVTTQEELESAWLVDVGWGDGPLLPINIHSSGEQAQQGRVFRLAAEEGFQVLEEKLVDGGWLKLYRFNLLPHSLPEFEEMCRYHQTSPESMFTRKKLATITLPGGRATLTGSRLILSRGSGLRGSSVKEERELSGSNEVLEAYQKYFGMIL